MTKFLCCLLFTLVIFRSNAQKGPFKDDSTKRITKILVLPFFGSLGIEKIKSDHRSNQITANGLFIIPGGGGLWTLSNLNLERRYYIKDNRLIDKSKLFFN